MTFVIPGISTANARSAVNTANTIDAAATFDAMPIGTGGSDPDKEQLLKLLSEGLARLQNSNEYSFAIDGTI